MELWMTSCKIVTTTKPIEVNYIVRHSRSNSYFLTNVVPGWHRVNYPLFQDILERVSRHGYSPLRLPNKSIFQIPDHILREESYRTWNKNQSGMKVVYLLVHLRVSRYHEYSIGFNLAFSIFLNRTSYLSSLCDPPMSSPIPGTNRSKEATVRSSRLFLI